MELLPDTKIIKDKCIEYDIKLSIIPDADHSLETADTMKNIAIINKVMDEIKKYL